MGEARAPQHERVTRPLASLDPFRVGALDYLSAKCKYFILIVIFGMISVLTVVPNIFDETACMENVL